VTDQVARDFPGDADQLLSLFVRVPVVAMNVSERAHAESYEKGLTFTWL